MNTCKIFFQFLVKAMELPDEKVGIDFASLELNDCMSDV